MKTRTPAAHTPARKRKPAARQTAPAGATLELNRKDIPPGTERFIVAKAQEWGCSPEQAIEHLLSVAAIRNPHAETPAELRSITIQLPAAHLDEVAAILPQSHGPASTLSRAVESCVRDWLCNLIVGYGDRFTAPRLAKLHTLDAASAAVEPVKGGRA